MREICKLSIDHYIARREKGLDHLTGLEKEVFQSTEEELAALEIYNNANEITERLDT